ncbi:Crp/Fnr family transcriptional regulator [Liquorilactobacillus aquaticus]|nr:Crp/Fnr family transcriptional regulator [Liquorilactobacillus aquaticus]
MEKAQQVLVREKLKQLRMKSLLDRQSIDDVSSISTFKEFSHKSNMGYRAGDSSKVYLIVSGIVSVKVSNEKGRNVRCFLLGRDDFFPVLMFSANDTSNVLFEISTCSKVEVLVIPAEEIKRLAKRNKTIHKLYMQMRDELIAERTNHAIDVSAPQMKERVIEELLFIGKKFGETCPEGVRIKNHWITREILGYVVGTTPKTVSATFSRLEKDSLVTLSRHVWILKPIFFEKYKYLG